MNKLANIHPVEILLEEVLGPLNIRQTRLTRDISVSPGCMNEIVHGKHSITADTDLRFSKVFGTSEVFWLGVQARYNLEEKCNMVGNSLNKICMLDCCV
jgi:addiction module HigA family antidote